MTQRRLSYSLIVVAVVIAYLPAIHSGFCNTDDAGMLRWLSGISDWNIVDHFFPKKGNRIYFRPLLTMTYVMDHFFWNASPLIMHIENILLHLVNTVLVFEITRISLSDDRSFRMPLLAALLFGLHPLNVEPVAWISGRTDLLCALFVFLSAIAVLKFRNNRKVRYLVIAVLTLFLGFLAKEVAIAFLPGAALLYFARSDKSTEVVRRKVLVQTVVVLVGILALFFAYYFIRDLTISTNSSRIGLSLNAIFDDLYYSIFVMLRAFGFYLKKVYLPFPLSFGIEEVDPLYEIMAIPIVLFCLWLLFQRSLRGALFLAGAFLLTPSFLVAFNQIAWTPYAERYLYLPLGFILPATVCCLGQLLSAIPSRSRAILPIVSVVLILALVGVVFHRAYIWRSNVRLFADTLEKNPTFKRGWNQYGSALYAEGELEKALASFEKASSLQGFGYEPIYDTNRATILEELGRIDEAIDLLRDVVQKRHGNTRQVRRELISLLEMKITQLSDENIINQLRHEIDGYK